MAEVAPCCAEASLWKRSRTDGDGSASTEGVPAMFHKLVVPLDGSDLAESALQYAVPLARAGQGRIILVRVAVASSTMTIDGSSWEYDQTQAVEDAEQYLRVVAETLGDQVPVET